MLAPVAGMVVLGLIWRDVPLRARWAVSRGSFEQALDTAPPPTSPSEVVPFDPPEWIGAYRITEAQRVGDGVLFYEENGTFVGIAGFAHLPSGPIPGFRRSWWERSTFRPLGDGWYAWTASW